jgi:hypothetical protein
LRRTKERILADDPKWELALLASVQGFNEKLLQEYVGGEVPVPQGLADVSLAQSDSQVQETLTLMRRWLRLLDGAITPAMLRQAFSADTDPEIAEAMLRYLVRKKDNSADNRDKADMVATFLYRHPRVPGQWERRGYGLDGSLPLSPFEIALLEILADRAVPSLPDEHVQVLRRFGPLQEEAEGLQDFNALVESGIIARVRELKQSLESSFYHPGVLATIAPYNAAFGKKFDLLFHAATAEIKHFAEALQEQGGSILGNVDGIDVTVDHVAGLNEGELLKLDYGNAIDKFRRVSQLKKTLERRPPIRFAPAALTGSNGGRAGAAAAPAVRRIPLDVATLRAAVTAPQIAAEETKLRKVEESIRVFVRVADPKFRQIVPMRFFNLTLTPAEADAYCADYLEEKSLRSGVARVLLRIVAVIARMTTEVEEMQQHENSPSLWKLHAESLATLLQMASSLHESASRLMNLSLQHHSPDHAESIRISLGKLKERQELVEGRLSQAV